MMFVAGCGSINGSGGASPATFFLPGATWFPAEDLPVHPPAARPVQLEYGQENRAELT